MKNESIIKKLTLGLFSVAALTACTDKLEEKTVGQATFDFYKTEAGVDALVNGAYGTLRYQFNGEQSFTLWEYGVDEYQQAADGSNKFVDSYTNQLNPTFGMFHDMWTAYYQGINSCNTGIKLIPDVVSTGGALSTQAARDGRIAELRFLRGYYYFQLVQQFGAIPINLEATEGVKLEFPRKPVADVYNVILSDLRAAETVLPTTQTQRGRATKWAARHMLAKVYLTRGSAVADQRGQKGTDMDSAAYFADQVITGGAFSLVPNYGDLWPVGNEANTEVIFAAQFNNNALLLNNSGNRVHLYFQMTYDVRPGMKRDINYGRPFRRIRPTTYTINVSDRKNDSRFYKQFRTAYMSNNAATIPSWTQADVDKGYTTADKVGKKKFAEGDTAVFITMDVGVSDANIAKRYYNWIPQNKWTNSEFPTLLKWMDPTRLDIGTEFSGRDGLIARLAETYLIAAEAYGRKGDYVTATARINKLRERAAYKAGEAKPTHFWKSEGGSYGDVSSTLAAITLPVDGSYWNTAPAMEQYPASAASPAQRFVHFMLNERTRELLGELHRWNDLVRTETLVERVKLYHPLAVANIKDFHKLRPIPQAHLERVFQDGSPLSAEQRASTQNPGY